MRLLETVAAHEQGAPAKQLARETGLALPTAYHLLRTLVHEGYLCRDRGLFFLGEAAERLSSSGAQQKRRSTVADTLARWRDAVGVPVYYAVYRDGEIGLVGVADTPANPAVEEWADFRETAHAHALGQCLLAQLDDAARRDHLDRYPVRPVTPYTVRDAASLLRRLEGAQETDLVIERQEYALGTVCAAIPSGWAPWRPRWPSRCPCTRPTDSFRRSSGSRRKCAVCSARSRCLSVSENSLLVICCVRSARFPLVSGSMPGQSAANDGVGDARIRTGRGHDELSRVGGAFLPHSGGAAL